MDSINSLLIIASAFSVFGQYIDNNHKNEFQSIKDELQDLDFSDAHDVRGLAIVKERWDDFMSRDCLRARPFVLALFIYLILTVASITLFSAIDFFYPYPEKFMANVSSGVTAIFGSVLVIISGLITRRLWKMSVERIKGKKEADEIMALYTPVYQTVRHYKEQARKDGAVDQQRTSSAANSTQL